MGSSFVLKDSATTYYDWVSTSVYDTNGQQRVPFLAKTEGTYICPVAFRVLTMSELMRKVSNMTNLINVLKFPLNGYKSNDTANKVYYEGDTGNVWSKSPDNTNPKYGTSLLYQQFTGSQRNGDERAIGRGIRCIKN
jgi:hypothetical protein